MISIQLVFGMLVASGAIQDNWIYKVGDFDKGIDQLGYLHNTPDFFAGLAWLHEQENVEGVYFTDNNFNYYYLHLDVPIYDLLKLSHAQTKYPGRKLFSHIITYGEVRHADYILSKEIGDVRIYRNFTEAPLYLSGYTSQYFEEPNWQNSARVLPRPIRR